jgi:hypothetical protein
VDNSCSTGLPMAFTLPPYDMEESESTWQW